jgi:hypothetical protein
VHLAGVLFNIVLDKYPCCGENIFLILYFRAVHVVIFILFNTNSCTLFNKQIYSHLKKKKNKKWFLKHIIKTLHISVTTVSSSSGGPSFVLSASTTFPLVCFIQLFIRYVAVCCLCVCVCVPDVLVCRMSGCEFIPNKQLDKANKRRFSRGTNTKDGSLMMVKQW